MAVTTYFSRHCLNLNRCRFVNTSRV